jgi:fructose-1,6-bisphosphatase/inositol monophosphatase family enzyme
MTTKLSTQDVTNFARDIQGCVVRARELFEQSNFTVTKKSDGSPVTMIDTEMQDILKDICRRYLSGKIHFVAEEDNFEVWPNDEPWWVFIDPIDGTTPLCAGDPSNACIAVGIFLHGRPYLGFVAKLSDLSVMYGGVGIDEVVHINSQGRPIPRRNIAHENKMWCMDYAPDPADNLVMTLLYNRLVSNQKLGGYCYNVPSIASALKLIEGHAKFFVGMNSRPWRY